MVASARRLRFAGFVKFEFESPEYRERRNPGHLKRKRRSEKRDYIRKRAVVLLGGKRELRMP
ncbi:hypothetical protein HanPI659440_Chr08g0292731 [Helianthus annuus]|nr:hypothetical protein HanPI659440_Chr08g0292731 [Helianthus annuus]